MNKIRKYAIWIAAFFIISCTNFGNFCKHGLEANASFNFKPLVSKDNFFSTPFYKNEVEITGQAQSAPVKMTWEILEDVTYKNKWNAQYKMDFMYPIFGNTVKKFKGQEVFISGYMIPLDVSAGLYAISRNNYASCFFCGGAGPETVVSLKFKSKPKRYKTDAYLTMKGTFDLNDTDVNEYLYIFRNTEEM